jgi:hypothetical protein
LSEVLNTDRIFLPFFPVVSGEALATARLAVQQLPLDLLPAGTKSACEKFLEACDAQLQKKRTPLRLQAHKPIPLAMLTPDFEV